jgi:exopolysaccharide biosynthesis polyprenyl glycosylphosphotransferase
LGRVQGHTGQEEPYTVAAHAVSASPRQEGPRADAADATQHGSIRLSLTPHLARGALRLLDMMAVGTGGSLAYIWVAPMSGGIVTAVLLGGAVVLAILWAARKPPNIFWEPSLQELFAPLGRGVLLVAIAAMFSAVWSHSDYRIGRWLLAWGSLVFANLVIVRTLFWSITRRWLGAAVSKRVAVYGNGPEARHLIEKIVSVESPLINLVGVVDCRSRGVPVAPTLFRGGIDDLAAAIIDLRCDELILALPLAAHRRICELSDRLNHLPIDVFVVAGGFDDNFIDLPKVGGIPLIRLTRRPLGFWPETRKRGYDCTLAILLLILLAPVLTLIGTAIIVDSRGPVLFRQRREGRGGSEIEVLKFRTMYADQSDPFCSQQSSDADPRVTRIGRFLRSTGLDELPQLINVLRGDMSIIGPRPHATGMRIGGQPSTELIPKYRRRAVIKPGITGWAQINGSRGPVESVALMEERVGFDLYYIENWSDFLDVKILMITVIQLLRDLIIARKPSPSVAVESGAALYTGEAG